MIEAVALGREVKRLVIGEPTLSAARTAEPGCVVILSENSGFGGGRIEAKDPAGFIVIRAGAEDGFGAIRRKVDGLKGAAAYGTTAASSATATAAVQEADRRIAGLTVVHGFDFTGYQRHRSTARCRLMRSSPTRA